MTGAYSQPFDLPSEECLVLVCSYIDHLLSTASQRRTLNTVNNNDSLKMTPTTPPLGLPTPPDDPPPRRSLDYVAERPNGSVARIIGEEYGIGTGYDEDDLRRQREKIGLRFSSKTVPTISISDYLERYLVLYTLLFILSLLCFILSSLPIHSNAMFIFFLFGLSSSVCFLPVLIVESVNTTTFAHPCSLLWQFISTESSIHYSINSTSTASSSQVYE